jgi:hypothetical protein
MMERFESRSLPSLSQPPLISVVLLAGERTEYVKEAIESVLRQTLVSTAYEIIVVAGTPELQHEAEEILTSARVVAFKIVRGDPTSVGRMLLAGIRASQNPVISMLHDDDTWAPEKLARVRDVFRAFPDCGYFKHGQLFIDARGYSKSTPLRRRTITLHRRRIVHIPADETTRAWSRLGRMEPDFNGSSISFRRSALGPGEDLLEKVDRSEDTFIYYAALANRQGLVLSDERLTNYRIHSSNTSLQSTVNLRRDLGRFSVHSEGLLATTRVSTQLFVDLGRQDLLPLVERERSFLELLRTIQSPIRSRSQVARRLLLFVPNGASYAVSSSTVLTFLGLLYLVYPSGAQTVYLQAGR